MSNRSISIILSSVMLGSIIFSSPPPVLATSHEHPSPTMEQSEKKVYKTTQSKIWMEWLAMRECFPPLMI
jgi:serine-type D-Ala-D-Ala carboxypeptidase